MNSTVSSISMDEILRIVLLLILVGDLFFAIFLFLRVKILAVTLHTSYSKYISYLSFMHMLIILVFSVVLGIFVIAL